MVDLDGHEAAGIGVLLQTAIGMHGEWPGGIADDRDRSLAGEQVDPADALRAAGDPNVGIDLAVVGAGAVDRDGMPGPDLDAARGIGRLIRPECAVQVVGRIVGNGMPGAGRFHEAVDRDVAALQMHQVGAGILALAADDARVADRQMAAEIVLDPGADEDRPAARGLDSPRCRQSALGQDGAVDIDITHLGLDIDRAAGTVARRNRPALIVAPVCTSMAPLTSIVISPEPWRDYRRWWRRNWKSSHRFSMVKLPPTVSVMFPPRPPWLRFSAKMPVSSAPRQYPLRSARCPRH